MSKKPEHPSVGLGVIIQRGEQILLGQRKGWQEGSYSLRSEQACGGVFSCVT